jgi:hypothetical protein
MNISQQIPDNIKCISRSLGYTLWLDNADEWFGLSVILRVRLTDRQRSALAYMTLRSLDHDQAVMTADVAIKASSDAGGARDGWQL